MEWAAVRKRSAPMLEAWNPLLPWISAAVPCCNYLVQCYLEKILAARAPVPGSCRKMGSSCKFLKPFCRSTEISFFAER